MICKYAIMQVCKYASMQLYRYSCYASMQLSYYEKHKYASNVQMLGY